MTRLTIDLSDIEIAALKMILRKARETDMHVPARSILAAVEIAEVDAGVAKADWRKAPA